MERKDQRRGGGFISSCFTSFIITNHMPNVQFFSYIYAFSSIFVEPFNMNENYSKFQRRLFVGFGKTGFLFFFDSLRNGGSLKF